MKLKSKQKEDPKIISHWLDYSEEKYGPKLVADTKAVLNILVMYIPLPIYWALLSQQASRWVFQATRMNGDIGWYTIKPDQMIVLGPLLITLLIPIFNKIVFPLLAKVGIRSSLQKMLCGMVCIGISFIVTAFIEHVIAHNYISILWLFPQFFLAAISEILLWVANVAFAYTQAPQSMKSVMTASVYLTVAGGSFIIFLISSLNLFESQTTEFIFYASLMFIDMIVFGLLAKRYKYIDTEQSDEKIEGGSA
jgi:dipeptide/tripeptide permease